MGVVMSGKGVPALLRNDIVRLLIVAVLGAGAVILIQSLTKGGHATKQAATAQAGGSQATGAGSGAAASGSRPAGSAATGKAAAKPGSTPAAAGAATIPTTPKGLARLSVTGRGLSVVVDQPSGPFAQQNRLILQGATVAVDQLNAAGGIGGHSCRSASTASHLRRCRQGSARPARRPRSCCPVTPTRRSAWPPARRSTRR
jgi:hypothetical protein